METGILAGKTFRSWTFYIPVLISVGFLGFATFLDPLKDAEVRTIFMAIGWCAVAATIGVGINIQRGWKWLTIEEGKITVKDWKGQYLIPDDAIGSLGFEVKIDYSQGDPVSITRKLGLWTHGKGIPATLHLETTSGIQEESPLQALFDRLYNPLLSKYRDFFTKNGSLVSDTWKLDSRGLTFKDGGTQKTLSLSEIASVGIFDDSLCVWEKKTEEPVFKIPAGGRNAPLMHGLLSEMLPKDEDKDHDPHLDGLGKVLFQRKGSKGVGLFLLLLSIGFIVGGAFSGFTDNWATGGILIGVGLVLGMLGWNSMVWRFACHEYGVRQVGMFSERKLPYIDVEKFTFSATRMFVNGVYSGTNIALDFDPGTIRTDLRIKYNATVQNVDADLYNLKDHIAGLVGRRMAGILAEGKPVSWTAHLRFLPEALEFTPTGFFGGKKEPIVIPFTRIQGFDLQEGYLHIWETGKEKSVIQEATSECNFYPGYFLLTNLFRPPTPQPAEPPPPPPEA